jgi:hypothetical protein
MIDDFWEDAEVVFKYTDADAVEDGVLMPVSFGAINLVTNGIVHKFSGQGYFEIEKFNSFMTETTRLLSEQQKEKADWFYSVVIEESKYFIARNGSNGFTLMLPEEY